MAPALRCRLSRRSNPGSGVRSRRGAANGQSGRGYSNCGGAAREDRMARWTDAEIAALGSDDTWDHEHGELVDPPADKPHSSVFAVRLSNEDARRIDYAAEQVGQTILEFMRQAA